MDSVVIHARTRVSACHSVCILSNVLLRVSSHPICLSLAPGSVKHCNSLYFGSHLLDLLSSALSSFLRPCVVVKVENAVPAYSHSLVGQTDSQEFLVDRLLGRRVLRMAYRRLLHRLLANYLASCLTATQRARCRRALFIQRSLAATSSKNPPSLIAGRASLAFISREYCIGTPLYWRHAHSSCDEFFA